MPQVTKRGECFDAIVRSKLRRLIVRAFVAGGKIECSLVHAADGAKGTRVMNGILRVGVESANPSTLSASDQKKAAALIGSDDTIEG